MFHASLLFDADPAWTVETLRGFLEQGDTMSPKLDEAGRLVSFGLQLGGHWTALAMLRDEQQLRDDAMDLRLMPDDAPATRFAWSFVFGIMQPLELRMMQGPHYPDDWAPAGRMRLVLELLTYLAPHGARAVLLHSSGNCVKPIDDFVYAAGDLLRRRGLKPFAALLDFVAYDGEGGLPTCHSYGLVHWQGLRDVDVTCASDRQEDLEAAMQAAKFACAKRVADNHEFEDGQTLAVPASFGLGWVLAPYRDDDEHTFWRVETKDVIRWHLRPSSAPPPFASLTERWAAASSPLPDPQRISRDDYRALILGRMQAAGYSVGESRAWAPTDSRHVRHATIERLRLAGDDAELLMTCGLGRIPTPMGTAEHGNVHIEVALQSRACPPGAVTFLEEIAVTFHFSEALGGVKPYDFISRGHLGTAQASGAILLPGNPVGLGAGADVRVFYAIPLGAEEYARIPRDDLDARTEWTLALLDEPGGLAARVDRAF